MIQYQENTQTDGRKSNNYNCSIMTFKSQKYRVQCLSDQKLLIAVRMQQIISIHTLIQQILGSHEVNNHARF